MRSTAAFCLSLWSLLWFVTPPLPAAQDRAADLLMLVNEERESRHLLPLVVSPELSEVALSHARELASQGEISHVNQAGQRPIDRVRAAGIQGFSLLAENLSRSTVPNRRLQAIVTGWLNSTSHRENLLNPAFNSTGIAVVDASGGETFAVQLFATF